MTFQNTLSSILIGALLSSASSFVVKPIHWRREDNLGFASFGVDSIDSTDENAQPTLRFDPFGVDKSTDGNIKPRIETTKGAVQNFSACSWEVTSPRNATSLSQSDHLVELTKEQ